MKRAVRQIDRALKSLYALDLRFHAERFLIPDAGSRKETARAGHAAHQGALLVRETGEGADIGIYLSPAVREGLKGIDFSRARDWSHERTSAFAVAAEEISHFHYLLFHAMAGRAVSQLELEVQAEIDKFLLLYFARLGGGSPSAEIFDETFRQLFEEFRLNESLGDETRERYEAASRLARTLVLKLAALCLAPRFENGLRWLRRYYRLSRAEKLSHISSSRV